MSSAVCVICLFPLLYKHAHIDIKQQNCILYTQYHCKCIWILYRIRIDRIELVWASFTCKKKTTKTSFWYRKYFKVSLCSLNQAKLIWIFSEKRNIWFLNVRIARTTNLKRPKLIKWKKARFYTFHRQVASVHLTQASHIHARIIVYRNWLKASVCVRSNSSMLRLTA